MKTTYLKISWLAYGLLFATTLYNCKTKDVSSITPFSYTFPGLDNLKLPDLVQTTPAAVSVTAGSVTSSTLASAVSSAMASITATGTVPDIVQQAGASVAKAVPNDKAASLVGNLSPDLVNPATISADMKKQLESVASMPALKAYMPTYTPPMVNGKAIGGRAISHSSTAIDPIAVANTVMQATDSDACKQSATTAYNTVVTSLDATRAAQTAMVNTTYTQRETAANGAVAGCQAGVPAKYTTLRATLKDQLNSSIATLNSVRSMIGDNLYNQLALMAYVGYVQSVDNVDTLQAADIQVCSATRDATIAAAKDARDTDLAQINSSYISVLLAATKARDQAIASCHNQGNGGW